MCHKGKKPCHDEYQQRTQEQRRPRFAFDGMFLHSDTVQGRNPVHFSYLQPVDSVMLRALGPLQLIYCSLRQFGRHKKAEPPCVTFTMSLSAVRLSVLDPRLSAPTFR
jgi:hypothetical protein